MSAQNSGLDIHARGSVPSVGAALARFVAYFDALTPSSLAQIGTIYAQDACFKDPFNDVRGLHAVRGVFAHMFAVTRAPRFVVLHALGNAAEGYVVWDFHFRSKGRGARDWTIHGATRLEFDTFGRVALHRDYWDAAEELYEHLPLVGLTLRAIKRRLGAR